MSAKESAVALPEPSPDSPLPLKLPSRPYPGLRAFEKDDWPIFFGRERITDAVISRLVRDRLLVIHGDSGCGKSSLVRSGVLPCLEQQSARGGIRWTTCALMPRGNPLWNLASALAGADGSKAALKKAFEIRRVLNLGRSAARELAGIVCRAETDHVCILIDQFEELFEHARSNGPEEAQLLVDFLIGLHEDRPPGLYAALTMRSEFLGACARFPRFTETVNATQYLLSRMEREDMVRAIREPATLYGGSVSPALAEWMIADAGDAQDQLPLIQHGLMIRHRDCMDAVAAMPEAAAERGWELKLEDGPQKTSLAQELSDHADEVVAELNSAWLRQGGDEHLVMDLMRALTEINAEGHAIRRPCKLKRLVEVTGAQEAVVRGVVDRFRADGTSFLKPYGSKAIDGGEWIDIGHEALIRCWRSLADAKDGWLVQEFNNGLVWRSLLVQADSFARNPENTLSPATTAERAAWLKRRNPYWAERYGGGWERVVELLRASEVESARKDAERLQLADARAETKKLRLRVYWALGTLIVVAGVAWYAWEQQTRAVAATARAKEEAMTSFVEREAALRSLYLQGQRLEQIQAATTQLAREKEILAAKQQLSIQATQLQAKISPRIYIHISDEGQRGAAAALEAQVESDRMDGSPVIVPGIQLVPGPVRRNILRCFRVEECKTDAPRLVEMLNRRLVQPRVVLEDASATFEKSKGIRDRHYELWFAPGEIELRSR